jgi:hypothetical protein
MKYLKTYKFFEADGTFMYDQSIESILPEYIEVIKGDPSNPLRMSYAKGDSRHLGSEVQIPYETIDKNGGRENPDTLEFDICYDYNTNHHSLSINVQVNYGELTACEFKIESPNKVNVIVYTSLHSKDDPSNTIFALDDETINKLCDYFNAWDPSFKVTPEDLKFIDGYDNYLPS